MLPQAKLHTQRFTQVSSSHDPGRTPTLQMSKARLWEALAAWEATAAICPRSPSSRVYEL